MQTPRLCIDGRAASEFDGQGLVAQELIDQLVAAQGEEAGSPWVERHRTVLLSHPEQIFSGQLKRFDTRKKIGSSFLYSAWERNFVQTSHITAFHRFRPSDRLEPRLECPTLTTLLPSSRGLRGGADSAGTGETFVVPSPRDRSLLCQELSIDESRVRITRPSVRRFVHFEEKMTSSIGGTILFLTDGKRDFDLGKLRQIVSSQYPQFAIHVMAIDYTPSLMPKAWMKAVQFASLVFYLTERPFDWPFPALEALYFDVPVIFMDNHNALSEALPVSPLRLSRYLTDFTPFNSLRRMVTEAREQLDRAGTFEALRFARQYRDLYASLDGASA